MIDISSNSTCSICCGFVGYWTKWSFSYTPKWWILKSLNKHTLLCSNRARICKNINILAAIFLSICFSIYLFLHNLRINTFTNLVYKTITFLPCDCMQRNAQYYCRNSVRPSVRHSVRRMYCDKPEWWTADILVPHDMAITLYSVSKKFPPLNSL